MSAAAIGAAGFLALNGLVHENDQDVRNEATRRRVELQEREHGKVCPYCSDRFHVEHYEFHLFIAHKATLAKEPR